MFGWIGKFIDVSGLERRLFMPDLEKTQECNELSDVFDEVPEDNLNYISQPNEHVAVYDNDFELTYTGGDRS